MGMFLIISGIFYLAYSLFSRNKKSVYFASVLINEDKELEYLNLQLAVSILNSVLLVVAGLIAFQQNFPSFYYTGIPVVVHLNNFIAKMIGFQKGYLADI